MDEKPDIEPAASAESVVAYGEGYFGLEVNQLKFESILQRGIIPEKWIKDSGYSNASFDSVCLTVIPQAKNAQLRFFAMSLERGNMNDFVDLQLSDEKPSYLSNDSVILGIVIDLSKVSKIDGVVKVKTNGHFDPSLYPTTHIDGLEDNQLARGKEGYGGGYKGEVRLEFTDEKKPKGISQELWKGLIVQEKDYPLIKSWVQTAKQQGVTIKSIPIFTPDMRYLGML